MNEPILRHPYTQRLVRYIYIYSRKHNGSIQLNGCLLHLGSNGLNFSLLLNAAAAAAGRLTFPPAAPWFGLQMEVESKVCRFTDLGSFTLTLSGAAFSIRFNLPGALAPLTQGRWRLVL